MRRLIVLIVSLFIAGFSFSQVVNLNGGGSAGDTISTYSNLTVTGTLTVTGVIDYSPPHMMVSFGDSSITPSMTDDEWVQITNATYELFTASDVDDLTFDGDSLTIEDDGDYMIDVSLSYGGSNTDVYEVSFFVNSVIESTPIIRTMTSNSIGVISLNWYSESLSTGDDITLKIRNTANNNDATLISCQWRVWMLHPR